MKAKKSYDNGGKTKKKSGKGMVYAGPGKAKKDMPFVRGRSEGFGSEGNMVMTERGNFRRGPVGPDYGDYVNQEKAAKDRLRKVEKLKSKGPDVIGLAKKVEPGTIKKSSVKIPVPAKKKKRRRKLENGGKIKKDSVRTDTLERSVDQVYANARREEEERSNSNKNNSGTTSGYRNVGRPLTTARPGAPAKVKTLGPKKIGSGVPMDKTLKKSTAKISAPAEKKRKRRLRRRK